MEIPAAISIRNIVKRYAPSGTEPGKLPAALAGVRAWVEGRV